MFMQNLWTIKLLMLMLALLNGTSSNNNFNINSYEMKCLLEQIYSFPKMEVFAVGHTRTAQLWVRASVFLIWFSDAYDFIVENNRIVSYLLAYTWNPLRLWNVINKLLNIKK